MASGIPGVAAQVVAYQQRMTALVVGALRGERHPGPPPSPREQEIAFLLLQLWFSGQVGWSQAEA
jgi:hypothetical protein